MFQCQKERVQLAVRGILAKQQGVMPGGNRFTQEQILKQEKLTPTACLEKIITEYSAQTDFDVIQGNIVKRLEEAFENEKVTMGSELDDLDDKIRNVNVSK